MNLKCALLLILGLTVSGVGGSADAAPNGTDWPQWQGAKRDNISRETGLRHEWPKEGPPKAWSITGLGEGYGTVAILGDKIYIQGTKDQNSVVFCLQRVDGKVVWTQTLGPRLDQDQGPGPRGTPTVTNRFIWAMDEGGHLACLNAKDGSIAWKRNILEDFKGANPNWHISESPLVDGPNVIVSPGGPDAGIVALDKKTGKTVWTSTGMSDPTNYCSCVIVNVEGIRAYTTLTSAAAVGVRASDGKPLWSYPAPANKTANITTPIIHGNRVFYTSNYGQGCGLIELKKEGDGLKDTEVYSNKEMQNHHGGVVLMKDHVYGYSGDILTCLEFGTGKTIWKDRSVGKGCLTYADGQLYLLSEANVVGLADATIEGYKERGRFNIDDTGHQSWAHPVVCGARLYIRNQGYMNCYDVSAGAAKTTADAK